MSQKVLDHFSQYEWNGLFWFPDDFEKKYSGKVTYTPERGIRIQLVSLDSELPSPSDGIARRIMHGAVVGDEITLITLINLSLSPKILFSQPYLVSMEGNVSYLVSGVHCENDEFTKLRIQYEEQFENIFFYPMKRDSQLVQYSKGPSIQLDSSTKISLDKSIRYQWLFSVEEIDTVFWSKDTEKLEQLKTCINNIMAGESFDLNRITSLLCVFDIESCKLSILKLFEIEEKWRSFWELLLDQALLPSSIWVDVMYKNPENGKTYPDFKPVLKNYYKPIKRTNNKNPSVLPQLPINITSFGEPEHDFSIQTAAVTKWFSIKNDPNWASVIYGINEVLNKANCGSTARYVALVSEIETLLNLLGEKKGNLDTLVNNYATSKWRNELTELLTTLGKDSLCLFLKEIRNVITHPKAASKCNWKYWNVARDQILLQKIYAYLAGLFIKAFLKELPSISNESIENYVEQFIELRASWHKIEYT